MNLADGKIGGTAACNGYGGNYTINGLTMTIGELAATEMGCAPEVMESEQAFMTALQRPLTLDRQADTLSVTGQGVDLGFIAVAPVPTAELVGAVWQLETLIDGEIVIQARGEATLLLSLDGTFTGSTGCRGLSGTYVITGDELQFPEMTAEGECPTELADQDSFVISVLEGSRVEIEGERLSLLSTGGEGLQYSLGG